MKKVAMITVSLGLLLFLTGCFGENDQNSNQNVNKTADTNQTSEANSKVPTELVGTWQSKCLTPDADSPWSEKHQFEIDAEGWATHTRWDWDVVGCTGNMNTLTNEYMIEFPSTGKIDLIDMGEGQSINDVYQLSGGTLLFGHGFRNNLSYSATYNEYIQYQKI